MMLKAVKKNGTPLWYVLFQDMGHQAPTGVNGDFTQYAWTMFVRQYLLE
jgi:hypothetical protein